LDEWNPIVDDMRDAFEHEVNEALSKTKQLQDEKFEVEVEKLSRWLATAAVNAGVEAATTSDPDETVGLEWVTMEDDRVRPMHAETAGQTVPSGQPFSVGDVELLYPGQPVGSPEHWINCRCVVRPALVTDSGNMTAAGPPGLKNDGTPPKCDYCDATATQYVLHSEGMAFIPACDEHIEQAKTDAAASVPGGQSDPENINRVAQYAVGSYVVIGDNKGDTAPVELVEHVAAAEPVDEITTTVIVALPSVDDPITAASSEEPSAHMTLLFLGESANLDQAALVEAIQQFIDHGEVTPVTDTVSGHGVLGKDEADVVLFDGGNLGAIRNGLLEQNTILEAHESVEQFPNWIPHVTLGYPETPALSEFSGDTVTFDRLALWMGGDNRTEFPLGQMKELPVPVENEKEFASANPLEAEQIAETAPTEAEQTPEAEAEPPMIPDEEAAVPVPFYGVLCPEGVATGDRRKFQQGSLTWRELPLPIKSQFVDEEGHKGSVISGRIDKIWRDEELSLIKYEGVFDFSEAAYETIRQIAEKMWRGVSVDLDSGEAAVVTDETGKDNMELSAGRICAATVCAIPAFAEAFIALGTWADEEAAQTVGIPTEDGEQVEASASTFAEIVPPQTKDGPGWITNPNPTHDITSYWVKGPGRAKIGWGLPGDFNRCRVQLAKYVQNPEWLAGLCANLHYRALGVWPGRETGKHSGETMPLTAAADTVGEAWNITATASTIYDADLFRQPKAEGIVPMTINEETGHVYGHIATWGTCHVGFPGECKEVPHSRTNYAYFQTGSILTTAGPVSVGQLTLGGGHADLKLGMRAAMAHYDNVTSAIADVCAYEDDYGIMVSGVLREDLSAKTLREARAASYSGDWREVVINGVADIEMIAALAVNVPGFPIPRPAMAASAGHTTALVAAGIVTEGVTILDETAEEARAARIAAVQSYSRQVRAKAIQNRINTMKGV
jgi:2'-5' RNA ligase